MAAAAIGADGAPQRSPSPQPGNLECVERFPRFCLHGASSDESPYSSNNNHHDLGFGDSGSGSDSDSDSHSYGSASPRASVKSSRSPTASSVSTSASSIDSCLPARAPTQRSRRDKKALHAARQQRSGSNASRSPLGSKGKDSSSRDSSKARWLKRSASSTPADALAAVEPAHDQGLARMTFTEQQRWITVQQKTFTKWCVPEPLTERRQRRATHAIIPQAEYQVGRAEPRGQGPGGGSQRWRRCPPPPPMLCWLPPELG